MTSSPSSFANAGKLQVLPNSTTLLFTQSSNNNNLTINNMSTNAQNLRQQTTQNGTILQHQMSNGMMTTTPTSIVRVNQPQTIQQMNTNQGQLTQQTLWTNATPQSPQPQFTLQRANQQSPIFQYATIKNEPMTSNPTANQQQQHMSLLQPKVNTQPVIRQTVAAQPSSSYTESQINDFVSKCRTFLSTLLRLAEKQAPEKLPMVRSCIQELLEGKIDPEAFTERLHTLYKSQPHTSLVPFFKVALPHMRQIVNKKFGRPITIELLEQLPLPPSSSTNNSTTNNNLTGQITTNNSRTLQNQMTNNNTIVNSSISNQQQVTSIVQQPLYTTVQTQQKINILQPTPQTTLIGGTGSLLSQQQQQQQQARAHINLTGVRQIVTPISTLTNPGLLSGQQQQHHNYNVQQITNINIQKTDSLLSRPVVSSTGSIPSQIITVNHVSHQSIKSEAIHPQTPVHTSMAAIQHKTMIKSEDDFNNDHQSTILETRQLARDDRFIPADSLRRRVTELANREKRTSIPLVVDDAALSLVSNAAQERLKFLLEQVKLIAQHRTDLSMKNDPAYIQTSDVKSQLRFLEDLDKIEKQKKDKLEHEKIFRAAKSRAKTNDPEAVQLKKKAKEIQLAQFEEQRQKEANETALAAIGKPKKRKLEESTNHVHQGLGLMANGSDQVSPIQPSPSSGNTATALQNSKLKTAKRMCRVNLRDLLLIMERDKCLKRSQLLVRALNK